MNDSFVFERVRSACSTFSHVMKVLMLLALLGPTLGCSTLSNGRGWGQDAFSNVHRKTMIRAAHDAFFDLQTLLPATAALILGPSDWDHAVSDWATEHTPMFGSQETASRASDYLTWSLEAETFTTLLATPSGPDSEAWWEAKGKGLGVEFAAAGMSTGTTQVLKRIFARTRPNKHNQRSFPSGHASTSFSMSTLSNRNLDSIRLAPWFRTSLQVGNLMLASSVAWARIEAGEHFPSDVLAGAALGHFFSAFIHDAFIGIPAARRFRLLIWPSKAETTAGIAFSF